MAYNSAGGAIPMQTSTDDLLAAMARLATITTALHKKDVESELDINQLRIDNLNSLANLKKELLTGTKEFEINMEYQSEKDDLEHKLKLQKEELALKRKAHEDWLKDEGKRTADMQKEIMAAETSLGKNFTDADRKQIEEKYKYTAKVAQNYEARARKERAKKTAKEAEEAGKAYLAAQTNTLFGKGQTIEERREALKELTHSVDSTTGQMQFDLKKSFAVMTKTLSNLTQQLDRRIEEIAANKAAIDTRLQGSTLNGTVLGSYWDKISQKIVGISGASPFYKQEAIVSSLHNLVRRGISYNITQRAFLDTIKDKIATTFDATNGTLLRLVRIQQQDTTASRLGMESALTSFLNAMYETTEYVSDTMMSVRGNLEETLSLMGTKEAVAFEYQVQKWLGSMYSVGMSDTAVRSISSGIGKLSSGDIEGLFGNGIGNLLVMAAGNAGLPLSDILAAGLDETTSNILLQQVVQYLADLYNDSQDNRVVQQQLAKVFGVTASDLKAAVNLAYSEKNTMKSIFNNASNFNESIDRLLEMTDTMWKRTSMGEMLSNTWSNIQYTMAAGLANDPVTYGIYKVAGLLDDAIGGIAIPAVSIMGNMVDLHTTVADLMRTGAMSASILKGLGSMLLNGGGGLSPTAAIKSFGIEKLSTLTRGEVSANEDFIKRMQANGNFVQRQNSSKQSVSESGFISTTLQGNASSSDIEQATMADANSKIKGQMAEAKEDEDYNENVSNETINDNIVKIYTLLSDVVSGVSALSVRPTLDTTGAWQ